MGDKKNKNIPMWAKTGHRRPVTRREFLASGIIPFTASLILPRWVDLLLPSTAHADTLSCAVGGSNMIPIITLNLSGGATLSSNFVPMDKDGQLLPSYDVMGLGDNQLPLEYEFGGVPFAGNVGGVLMSKMLQGMREKASEAIQNTSFTAVCVRSRDDSGENQFSIDGLVTKAGLVGSQLPNLGVRSNSITGIGQKPSFVTPPSPLIVSSFNSISGALSYAGAMGSQLNSNQKQSLAKLISNLSQSQANNLANIKNTSDVKNVLDCAGIKNIENTVQTPSMDPRQDTQYGPQLSALWGINSTTTANNQNVIFSSIIYNVLNGVAGAGSIELGGYDYHDNTRTTGDAKDLQAGQVMGLVLQTAHIMKRPVFLYVMSDGSTSSVKSNARNSVWTSDRGSAGTTYMMYYDPNGRKQKKGNPQTNFQIGSFTSGQSADDLFVTGNSPELAAAAVFGNYLALNNKLDLFSSIVKSNSFTTTDLDKVLVY